MASGTVQAAVRERVDANWAYCPVVYPNGPETQPPTDGSPFLSVQYPVGRAEQITIGAPGSNVFRDEGAMRFVLSIPAGLGSEPFDPWIEELRVLFRSEQFGPISTFAPGPSILDDRNDDGLYFKLSFSVEYYAEFTG